MIKKKSEQGIALVWVILASVLLITGMGGVLSKKQAKRIKVNQGVSQSDRVKKEVGEKGEEFVGQIKEAITKGIPMKCTYTQEGFTGVSFIKGKKMYSEVSTEGGVTTYTIIKDNCMWNWGRGAYQGTKMCFDEDVWAMPETIPAGVEYHCVPFSFTDSQFEPPAEINFMATGEAAPPSDEDLLKILPPKERTELEKAIRETQQVLKNIEIFNFTPPSAGDITKGLNQINRQTQEQIQKNIEKQRQEFQPIDTQKMMEYFKQNPPAVPHEGEQVPPEAQEYYYRKYILKDPAFQY